MRKVFAVVCVFVFTFFFLSSTSAYAKVIGGENVNVNIPKNEIVNDDLFIGTQTVQIDGTVNGDVFIGAQTVKITGIINGNLHVGANTIDLSGRIKGNAYLGAQSILLSGAKIGGSLLTGSATINADETTTIGGSFLAGAGTISVNSQITRSLYAGSGSLTLGEATKIGKDLYYASGDNNQVTISDKAAIAGTTYKSEVKTIENKQIPPSEGLKNGFKLFTTFVSFVGALIVGLLYFKFFPESLEQSSKLVSNSFWKSLGVGFLVVIGTVPALLVLAITVVGIPVAGVAIALLTLYSYLAKIVVGLAFGKWLSGKFSWKTSAYGALVIGLLAIYVLKMIPYAGPSVGIAVLWAGLGALTVRMISK